MLSVHPQAHYCAEFTMVWSVFPLLIQCFLILLKRSLYVHRPETNPPWICGSKLKQVLTAEKVLSTADSEDRRVGHLQYLKHNASYVTSVGQVTEN